MNGIWGMEDGGSMWGQGKREDVWCAVSQGVQGPFTNSAVFSPGPGMKSSHLRGQVTAKTVWPSVYVCHEDMIDKSWQQGGGEVEDSVGPAKDSFRERHAVSKFCEEQMLGGLLGRRLLFLRCLVNSKTRQSSRSPRNENWFSNGLCPIYPWYVLELTRVFY